MATTTMEDYFQDVENAMDGALLVAFDGCHKIYLAMDEEQANWFTRNYNPDECETSLNLSASPKEMLAKVREWWNESCGLRFISAVWTNEQDPNAGFKTLIPQGASDEEESWYDDEDEEY